MISRSFSSDTASVMSISRYMAKYQVTLTIKDIDDYGFWNYTSQSNVKNTCGGDSWPGICQL